MTNYSEHIFMCLLIICISSFVKFLFKSFAVVCFSMFCYWAAGTLCIADAGLLSGEGIRRKCCDCVLPGRALLRMFWVVSCEEQVVLVLRFHLLTFFSVVHIFCVLSLCLTQGQREIFLYIWRFMISVFMSVGLWPILNLFLSVVWGNHWGLLFFPLNDNVVVFVPQTENTVLYPLNSCGIFYWKSIDLSPCISRLYPLICLFTD